MSHSKPRMELFSVTYRLILPNLPSLDQVQKHLLWVMNYYTLYNPYLTDGIFTVFHYYVDITITDVRTSNIP